MVGALNLSSVGGRLAVDIHSNYCVDSVRVNDPDRYILAMLASSEARAALFVLYAFNVEIARTRELVSEPALGEIRLQWWRDGIAAIYAGDELRHEVGHALGEVISAYGLTRAHFDRLIDARADDLDDNPPETLDELVRYAADTTAPLISLALQIVGESTSEAKAAARHIGVAWSLIGLVRALPFHLRSRRQYLPRELTRRHNVAMRNMLELKPSSELNSAIRSLLDIVVTEIRAAREIQHRIGRGAVPVLLQARLAEFYLQRLASFGFDPFDPRNAEAPPMAVWRLAWSKFRGRY
jgi:phytoene synthase